MGLLGGGLGNCPKCWERVCICGHEYPDIPRDEFEKHIDNVLEKRELYSDFDNHTVEELIKEEISQDK